MPLSAGKRLMDEAVLTRRKFIEAGAAALAAGATWAQDDDGFAVHEWGVISVPYGGSWGNVRSGDPTLPAFVTTWRKAVDDAIEKWKNEPVMILKPVLYFHSREPRVVDVRVGVPLGRPAAWHPPASEFGPRPELPIRGGRGLRPQPAEPPLPETIEPKDGFVQWNRVAIHPEAGLRNEAAEDHWWSTARRGGGAPVAAHGVVEDFLFYDALTPVDPKLRIEWHDDRRVTLTADAACEQLTALCVRDGTPTGARIRRLDEGQTVELTLGAIDRAAVAENLEASGLSRAQADGMARIWEPEFLRTDGIRVIASLPRERIEALLPLTITPAPDRLIRTLLMHVECLDAAQCADVDRWIRELGNDDVETRDRAMESLRALGPRAEAALRKAYSESRDLEVRERAGRLLLGFGVKP